MDKIMAWQLGDPSRTAEDCIAWLEEANSKRVKLERGSLMQAKLW